MSSVFELVWVRNNLTSSKSIVLAATDFNSPPAAPTGLTATLIPSTSGSDAVSLSWTDNSNNETGFTLGYSNDGGTTWTPITLPPATTSYSDTSASRGVTRSYRVQATDSFGASAWAASASSVTIPYLITFTYQESGVADSIVEGNTDFTVTAPSAPTQSGYSFNGWFTQATGGTAWNFTASKVSANTTLYAQWVGSATVGVGTTTNYQGLTLAASPSSTVTQGTSVTLSATLATVTSGWTWYIDGVAQTGQSSSSLTLDTSTMLVGNYLIAASVSSGGVAYSGSLTITVTR
jgi:uncharacterized repeat protein (TIGR02543 family)